MYCIVMKNEMTEIFHELKITITNFYFNTTAHDERRIIFYCFFTAAKFLGHKLPRKLDCVSSS